MNGEFPFGILRPEVPREPPFWVSQIDHRAKLDQNESPFDCPEEIKSLVLAELERAPWNRYPQPGQYAEIKRRFAAAIGQPAERIVLTAGEDQLILLAFLVAGGRGRRARVWEPTYPMYVAAARANETEIDRVVLGPDYDLAAAGLGDAVDLICLVSPNNPTGNGPDRQLVLTALERDVLVFVDEAYADYSGDTVVDLVETHPNLLVGRSLSKSRLAGARLGYGVGHPQLIEVLESLVFSPYNLSHWQLAVALHFDKIQDHLARGVRQVVRERERVQDRLYRLGVRFWQSRSNFVLFEVEEAATVNHKLLDAGIRIRDVSALPGLGRHLRVTIGTPQENDLFLTALATCLESPSRGSRSAP